MLTFDVIFFIISTNAGCRFARMKSLKFTRHAKNRMRMHEITEAEVETSLEKPDFIEPSVEGRINAWKKIDDKFLRVTYKDESARVLIITAVRKKKGWR